MLSRWMQQRCLNTASGAAHLPQALQRIGLAVGPRRQQQLFVRPQWQQGPPAPELGMFVLLLVFTETL